MGKILIVDDEAAIRLTTARILRDAGHDVVVASNGEEGLRSYRATPADLVLMDLYMPEKEGLETLLQLRKEFPSVTVVAMSGHKYVKLMLRAAKELGAVRTLRKPFEPEVLVKIVAEELQGGPRSSTSTADTDFLGK